MIKFLVTLTKQCISKMACTVTARQVKKINVFILLTRKKKIDNTSLMQVRIYLWPLHKMLESRSFILLTRKGSVTQESNVS